MPAGKPVVHPGGESGPARCSLRAFAKKIGVWPTAVCKAVATGRLPKSVGKDAKGKPFIANVDLAVEEWNASSRTSVGVHTVVHTGVQTRQAEALPPPAPRQQVDADADEPPDEDGGGQLVFAHTLIAAQTLATNERARKLKYENDVTEGRLVPVEIIAKEAFEAERTIREAILNVPARLSGELAAETDPKRVHARLDAALRECLTSAAAILLETVNA